MLNDFGRSSIGVTSQARSSVARLNKVIDLDLNSIEFNTPPREHDLEVEFFEPTEEVSAIAVNAPTSDVARPV